jgi:hypothetical protein
VAPCPHSAKSWLPPALTPAFPLELVLMQDLLDRSVRRSFRTPYSGDGADGGTKETEQHSQ